MNNFPFHAAAHAPDAAQNSFMRPAALTLPPVIRAKGSQRRKLWDIPHKFHCPVIGVCFDCDALRGLMQKVMRFPRDTTDFMLHTTAVGNCEERTRLAELLHKNLERRFQLTIKQFSLYKTHTELHTAWQKSSKTGQHIPATLWAIWTHPACDSELEQEIYADIHMIQHQIGAGARADLKAMKTLEAENTALQGKLNDLIAGTTALRQDKAGELIQLKQQIGDLRTELAASEGKNRQLQQQLDALHEIMPALDDRQVLRARHDQLAERNAQLKQRVSEQDKELARLREFARYAEETLESLAREDEALTELPVGDLSGKCVLCVGGRSGAVTSYREVVEQSGGRFLHHDGGLEESMHRIDGVVAAADLVICQAGCISHNAYWRVKDLCKRTGKACLFVKSSGISSFEKAVRDAEK
jgi:hypothetical protein